MPQVSALGKWVIETGRALAYGSGWSWNPGGRWGVGGGRWQVGPLPLETLPALRGEPQTEPPEDPALSAAKAEGRVPSPASTTFHFAFLQEWNRKL